MKKLHKYKIDHDFYMVVYSNNSKSNYNIFVASYQNGCKQAIHGFTERDTVSKDHLIERAKRGIRHYLTANNLI